MKKFKKNEFEYKNTCEFIEGINIKNDNKYYPEKVLAKEQLFEFNDARKNILKKFYDKHLFRLLLKCEIQDGGEAITVILMNPSYADENGLDGTLNNVKEFLKIINGQGKYKFSSFEVLNIFPIRMAKSKCLLELLKKYDLKGTYRDKNTAYIKKHLNNKIILAWGADYHKSDEVKQICETLKNKELYVYRLNKSKGREGTPSHFAPQVYNPVKNKELIPVELVKRSDKLWFIERKS